MEKNILVILIIFVVSINSQVTNQRATVDSEIQPEQQQQQQTSDIEIESKGVKFLLILFATKSLLKNYFLKGTSQSCV